MMKLKGIIFLIIISLLCTLPAFAGDETIIFYKPAGATLSCTGATAQFSQTTDDAQREVGEWSTTDYWAYRFAYAGTTGTLCRVIVKLSKTGSPAGNAYISVLNDNSAAPGSSLTTCGSMVATGIDAGGAEYTFNCGDAAVTNGNYYWVQVYYDSANSSNYIKFSRGYGLGKEYYSGDGSAWTEQGTSGPYLKVYIKE